MTTRILATAACTALLTAAAHPAAAALSGTYFDLGDGSNVYYESGTGPVVATEDHHYDFGASHQEAAASFQHQTTRVQTTLSQTGSEAPGSWITADTEADYRKDLVMPVGAFGPVGTLMSLPLTLRFDGYAITGGGLLGDGRTLSSIDTYFSFRVLDLDDQICGEGCRPRELASLGFRGYVSFDSGFFAAGRERVANFDWSARELGVTVAEDSYDDYQYEKGVFGDGAAAYTVDTGVLHLNVVTRAGHTLRIESSLDVFDQSMVNLAWSNVQGNFHRTFDADLLLPDGSVPDGEILGAFTPTPVPLPGAAWALGSGVLLLAARGRRRG